MLYVGMSLSALRRLEAHRYKAGWATEIARVEIEWFDTRADASAAERLSIQTDAPEYNRILYKPKPPPKPKKPKQEGAPDHNRETTSARLRARGYVALSGWVPAAYAKRVLEQVEMHREDVERIKAEPARPRGRPKRSDPASG